jgi:MFS family permease
MVTQSGPRFGAFSYGAYRRYWLGTVARVFGIQFRFIGVGWFVVSGDGLDLSPIWLGPVGLAGSLPTILGSIPAGLVAERYEHKHIMSICQGLTAALSLGLALGILAGRVDVWILIGWAIVTGALTAIATPAQSAMLPRLIERDSMASGVAGVSGIWNSMRIVGPAGAGVLIAWIGIGQAFFVTALGFALSALLIGTLQLAPVERHSDPAHEGMMAGVRYIRAHPIFFATIGLSFFTSIFGGAYQTLLPVFADDVLDVGAPGFGMLESAVGFGGLLGTISIVKLGRGPRAGQVMLGAAAAFGVLTALYAGSREMWLSTALLFAAGFASSVYLNIGMTTLQLLCPDELRGRVMGVWSMTWFLAAVGGVPASALAEWIGAPWTVALGALSVTVFAIAMSVGARELRRLPAAATTQAA